MRCKRRKAAKAPRRFGPALGRRDFLFGAVAAPIVAAVAGCRSESRRGDRLSNAASDVATYHRDKGPLPESPVAVAWDPSVTAYPRIHELASFTRERSGVYELVAKVLMLLNPDSLDNPLAGIVRQGDTVVIKPNWCSQAYFPLPITHPSVVYPLVEFALMAGASRVRIVEAPMTLARGCDWFWSSALIGAHAMTKRIRDRFNGADVEFVDGNGDEFVWVDVGEASELLGCDFNALDHDGHTGFEKDMFFDVADSRGIKPGKYKPGLGAIARSYLDCDVFINVPKMKTHGYTGITAAIKNLMGLNIRSTIHKMPADLVQAYEDRPDYLQWRESPMRDVPHFDRTKLSGKDGPWFGATREDRYALGFGNDVLWRTLADLNKMIVYADREGVVHEQRQRRYLAVVDGIIGTDGNGPITDSTVHAGCIVAGQDACAVDAVCARVMGWEPSAIRLIQACSACRTLPIGTAEDYLGRMVGVTADAGCFETRFQPPDTFAPKIIEPNRLVRT